MNERVKRLTEEIRKLPPEEQADLIDELLVLTYREPDPEIDKAWAEEAERRLQRYKAGLDPARGLLGAAGKPVCIAVGFAARHFLGSGGRRRVLRGRSDVHGRCGRRRRR